jgi:hypothetical protein
MLVLHDLRKAHDGVQGRAQFMAHIGEESGLRLVGALGLVHRDGQAAGHDIQVRPVALHLVDHVARIENDWCVHYCDVQDDVDQHPQVYGLAFRDVKKQMHRDGGQHRHGRQRGGGAVTAKTRQLVIQRVQPGTDPRRDVYCPPVHPAPP